MSKYDERYEIRIARVDEIDEIMEFLDKYWKKGHILARDRDFFEYEMVIDGQVNFVIAKERETGRISGMHGFLIASKNKEKLDTWGSIWKVLPDSMGLLGLEIVRRLEAYTKTRAFLSIGGNPETTVPILQRVRHFEDVGKMQHFYCLAEKDCYSIAQVKHYEPIVGQPEYKVNMILFKSFDRLKNFYNFKNNENDFPYKDGWYIKHRYFEHPIFHYLVYGLRGNNSMQAIIICREQEYNGATVLRIVDYIGEPELFGGISWFFKEGLKKYEYIDFYCYGFPTEYVRQAGMIEIQDNDTNIIPNYFGPFVAKNIDIWVGTPKGHAKFFKADGDQDRPT